MLSSLVLPAPDSHKGDNGKVLVVGGSELFHGASLWAVKVLTRLVDMVFFSSVPEVECVVNALKAQLWDFIYIPREKVGPYADEADVILFGPGMTRQVVGKINLKPNEINWHDTYQVLDYLIKHYSDKKWVIDAGGLQVMPTGWLRRLPYVMITPHRAEFVNLFKVNLPKTLTKQKELVKDMALRYQVTIVLKGRVDIITDLTGQIKLNRTGNQGMTKGGSGDLLAGLAAGLWVKNPPLASAWAAAYLNGLAGDTLYQKVGPFYNTSDLCDKLVELLWYEIQADQIKKA